MTERYAVNGHTAFSVLVRYSQDRNVKLQDIARQIVQQREDNTQR